MRCACILNSDYHKLLYIYGAFLEILNLCTLEQPEFYFKNFRITLGEITLSVSDVVKGCPREALLTRTHL